MNALMVAQGASGTAGFTAVTPLTTRSAQTQGPFEKARLLSLTPRFPCRAGASREGGSGVPGRIAVKNSLISFSQKRGCRMRPHGGGHLDSHTAAASLVAPKHSEGGHPAGIASINPAAQSHLCKSFNSNEVQPNQTKSNRKNLMHSSLDARPIPHGFRTRIPDSEFQSPMFAYVRLCSLILIKKFPNHAQASGL